MNHISANVAQKLKSFVRWMTHEDRPYELHDDFLATLTREVTSNSDTWTLNPFQHHHHLIMNPPNSRQVFR